MGGRRGRIIARKDREHTVRLIRDASKEGAGKSEACKLLGISVRTFERWASGSLQDLRKGASKSIPRKLTEEERLEIVQVSCSSEYKDDTPYTIFTNLLEQGRYIGSISTMYRVLKEANKIHHRENKHPGTHHSAPEEAVAFGPNQVWTWDITWLPTEVKGIFKFSYNIIDIWDKKIVGWAVQDRESEFYAKELFEKTLAEQGYPGVHIHSDNGNPMKGVSLLAMLYERGCKNSFSRPRVSNDNPFIESFFATVKGSVKFPGQFKDLEHAREWMAEFVNWYNTEHRHSGIEYFTPAQMRSGEFKRLVEIRNETMKKAREDHPERWGKKLKQWKTDYVVYLNPSLETRKRLGLTA